MDHKEFSEYLKDKELFEIIKNKTNPIKNILQNNFDPYNEVVILSDYGYPTSKIATLLAGLYSLSCKELNTPHKILLQQPKLYGEAAEDKIIEAILQANEKTLILICFSDRMGSLSSIGKSFRKYAHNKKIPFLSSRGLSQLKTSQFTEFFESIDIDYKKIRKQAEKIKEILDNGKSLNITTPAGTDLTLDITKHNAILNDGYYHNGKGGNLPVGEVYIAPTKRKGNGKVVIDLSSKNQKGTIMTQQEPIIITIKDGAAVSITGGYAAEELNKSLQSAIERAKHPWGIKLIGELGIGINPKAKLLGATIINEKKAGTAHIALGSNSWFGGEIYSITHYDQVFDNPTIKVDNIPIDLKNILTS